MPSFAEYLQQMQGQRGPGGPPGGPGGGMPPPPPPGMGPGGPGMGPEGGMDEQMLMQLLPLLMGTQGGPGMGPEALPPGFGPGGPGGGDIMPQAGIGPDDLAAQTPAQPGVGGTGGSVDAAMQELLTAPALDPNTLNEVLMRNGVDKDHLLLILVEAIKTIAQGS